MKHTATRGAGIITPKNFNRLTFRFACVNDHRQVTLARRTQLALEYLHLHITRRVVVMKIETDLAPCHDAFAGFNKLFRSLFSGVVVETRVVWMRADSGVKRWIFPAEFDGTFKRAAMRIASANVQNRRYTRG